MIFFNKKKEKKEPLSVPDTIGEQLLTDEEKKMMKGVMTLEETIVKEAMVPRIDAQFLAATLSKDEALKKIIETGFSRYPVYKETIDNVIGVLYVKDLISALYKNEEFNIEKLSRKPFFVPESKKLDSLLREFRKKRVHIAVAVDEYGGVSGILCLEDIIERIVGDIQDEFDNENEELVDIGNGEYLADARMNIDQLNLALNLDLPNENVDTIGGFVFNLFGKIPASYEKAHYDDTLFIVQKLDGHKIQSIKIVKHSKEKATNG